MWKNISLNSVTKFAQDVLNDSAFNASEKKDHLSDEEGDTYEESYDDSESFNLTEQLSKLQERDTQYEKDRLENEIEQLQEQLRASRLETESITKEFRKLIDVESREKKKLQANYDALNEEYHQLSTSLSRINDDRDISRDTGAGSEDRFEIQRLRAMLHSTKEENKRLSGLLDRNRISQEDDFFSSELGEDSANEKVRLMTAKMNKMEENFQQQLSSMQKIHTQKMKQLEQSHREEMEQREQFGAQLPSSDSLDDKKWERKIKKLEDKYALQQQLLESRNEELEAQLRQVNEKYEALSLNAKQELEKKTHETQVILQNMESQHEEEMLQTLEQQDQLQAANARLNKKIESLTLSLQNKDEQINILADNRVHTEKGSEELRLQLTETQRQLAELQHDIQNMKDVQQQLESTISQLNQELEESQANCQDTQEMNQELIRENQELETKYHQAQAQFESMSSDATNNQAIIQKLQGMNKQLLQKQDSLLEERRSFEDKIKSLKPLVQQKKQLEKLNDQLHNETETLHRKLTALEAGSKNPDQSSVIQQKQIEELEQKYLDAQNDTKILRLENDNLRNEVQSLEKLRNELEEIQQCNVTLRDKLTTMENDLSVQSKSSHENASLHETIYSLEEKSKQQEILIENLKNQQREQESKILKEYKNTNEDLQRKVIASERKNEELSMQLDSMKENMNMFTQQEAKMKMQLSMAERKAEAAIAEYTSKIQVLQSQLQDQILQQESLVNEQIQQQQSFQSLKREKEQEIHQLTTQLSSVREDLTIMKEQTQANEKKTLLTEEKYKRDIEALQKELEYQRTLPTQDPEQQLQIEELQQALEKANHQSKQLTNHLLEKDNEVIELQEQIDSLQQESTELKEKLQEADEKNRVSLEEMEQLSMLQKELESKKKECEENAVALNNLQSILEDKQAEHEGRLQTQLNVLTSKYEKCKHDLNVAQKEIETLEAFRNSLVQANERIVSLQEELDGAQRDLQYSRKEVEPLRSALNDTLAQLNSFGSSEQNFIDKRVVTQLIITYVTESKKEKKRDVLEVMSRILNFNEDEQTKVGLVSGRGRWSIPFFGGSSSTEANTSTSSNLVNMWVDFLLKESERAENEFASTSPGEQA